MTKLITASLYFHPAAILFSPQILKTSSVYIETPFFNWRYPRIVLSYDKFGLFRL